MTFLFFCRPRPFGSIEGRRQYRGGIAGNQSFGGTWHPIKLNCCRSLPAHTGDYHLGPLSWHSRLAVPPRARRDESSIEPSLKEAAQAQLRLYDGQVALRPLQPRASLLGLLLRSLTIRRSAAATRFRARTGFLRGPFATLLARMAALSCFPVAIVPLRLSRRIPPLKHIRRGFMTRVALILGVHGAGSTTARSCLRAEREA